MTELKELKEGLWWARHKVIAEYSKKEIWTRWVVVSVRGKSPFLNADIVFDPGVNGSEPYLSFPDHVDKWQFGPQLDMPSKHYVEVRELEHEPK